MGSASAAASVPTAAVSVGQAVVDCRSVASRFDARWADVLPRASEVSSLRIATAPASSEIAQWAISGVEIGVDPLSFAAPSLADSPDWRTPEVLLEVVIPCSGPKRRPNAGACDPAVFCAPSDDSGNGCRTPHGARDSSPLVWSVATVDSGAVWIGACLQLQHAAAARSFCSATTVVESASTADASGAIAASVPSAVSTTFSLRAGACREGAS
eukprot:297751-Pleurochrysis_carterae.AAC.5